MSQNISNAVTQKPVFTAAPSQPHHIPHPYLGQNPPSDAFSMYHFLRMPGISPQLMMSDPLGLTSNCVPGGPPVSVACSRTGPEASHDAAEFSTYKPFVFANPVIPPMSPSQPPLPAARFLQENTKSTLPEKDGGEKEIICIGVKPSSESKNSDNGAPPAAKKFRNYANEREYLTSAAGNGHKQLTGPGLRASETNNHRKECSSVSSPAVSSTTEAENEIVELKVKIDSLYAKLNEIQRKHEILDQYQGLVPNSRRSNDDSCSDSCGGSNSGSSSSSSDRSQLNNEGPEPVCCSTTNSSDTAKPAKHDDAKNDAAKTNVKSSAEAKTPELLPRNNDRWESNGEFWETEPEVFQKPRTTTTTIGVGADGGIILAQCSQEKSDSRKTHSQQLNRSVTNNHDDSCSVDRVKESKDPTSGAEFRPRNCDSLQKTDANVDANFKMRLAFLSARRKVGQYRSNATLQKSATTETKKENKIIGVKRIQEFRDAICSRPANSKEKQCILKTPQNNSVLSYPGTSIQNPYFPQNDHPLQSHPQPPTCLQVQNPRDFPMLRFPQPGSSFPSFGPIAPYGPLPFFPGISAPLKDSSTKNPVDIYPYNQANPNNPLLYPEQFRLFAPSSTGEQFFRAPSAAVSPSMAPHQQRQSVLMNDPLVASSAGSGICNTSNCMYSGAIPQSKSGCEQKSPPRNG